MHVHHRLVVLIECDEMREGGHEGLQLREAFPSADVILNRTVVGWPTRIVFCGKISS